MTIIKTGGGESVTLSLEGRLDTNTAPMLETELRAVLPGLKSLTLDMARLDYVSSAGLRALLFAQKQMNRQGRMIIRHVNKTIMDAFLITGFTDILTIE